MRYPWVNLALLILLAFQLVTGFLGLINGIPALAWILQLHQLGAFAMVLLLGWKGIIIFDAFKRVRRLSFSRLAFLLLTIFLLIILATGFLWHVMGYAKVWLFSLMTIHVLVSIGLLGLLLWHTLARRYVFNSPTLQGRRVFIRFVVLTIGGWLFSNLASVAEAALSLPAVARRFTGSYEIKNAPGDFPAVTWLLDYPAPITRESWQLIVDGTVERPLSLNYDQVAALATDSIVEIIDCTGGWYSTQEWRGVKLELLLNLAGVKSTAHSITVEAVSGYGRRFTLDEAQGCLLATQVAGETLNHGHGFPLRLVAPNHRGFDWVKWVTAIHVNETSKLLQPPVPLQ